MNSHCKYHGEPYQMFCKTDGVQMCLSCIASDEHKGHDFQKLKTVADDKRCMLKEYVDEKLPQQEQTVKEKLCLIQNLRTQNEESKKKVRKQVHEKKKSVVSQIEKEFTEILEDLERESEKNEKGLTEAETEAKRRLKKLQDVKTLYSTDLNSKSDSEILNSYGEFEEAMEQDDLTIPYIEFQGFKESKSSVPKADVLFGKICTVAEVTQSAQAPSLKPQEVEQSYSVNVDSDGYSSDAKEFVVQQTSGAWLLSETYQVVTAVQPWDDGKLWIACFGSKKITLVDGSGAAGQTISCNTSVHGIAALGEGTLLLLGKEKVRQFNTATEKIADFINPKPLYPTAICVTKESEILLCLVDSFVQSDRNDDEKFNRVVNVYTGNGEQLNSYRKVHGKSFGIPNRVAYDNTNNVICIFDKQFEELVAFDRNSRGKFRYEAKHVSAICYDRHGYLLVGDHVTHVVNIFDCDGNFLSEITAVMSSPRSLAIDAKGRLVVGCANGVVKKIRYK